MGKLSFKINWDDSLHSNNSVYLLILISSYPFEIWLNKHIVNLSLEIQSLFFSNHPVYCVASYLPLIPNIFPYFFNIINFSFPLWFIPLYSFHWFLHNLLPIIMWTFLHILSPVLFSFCSMFSSFLVCWCAVHSRSVVSDSSRPFGQQPAKLLCPWDCSGKNTGVDCHFLLQGIFQTQGSNLGLLCLLHCRQILYYLEPSGKPIISLFETFVTYGGMLV